MDKMARMRELIDNLTNLAYHYYVLDKPIVSDYDYDKLYDELVSLEAETGVVLPSSPTLKVGGEVLSGFKKVRHEVKLYSLNKCNDYAGLNKFIDDVNKSVSKPNFTVEYKFDGLRIVAKYTGGVFVSASTRGDGEIGEDVTAQVKTIKSVPLKINYLGELTVAGEGVITVSNLEKYNKTANEKLKNPRNAVSGAIRNLDINETKKRNLDVVFYDLIKIDNDDLLKTQEDVQNFLKDNHFLVGQEFEICSSAQQIEKIIERVDKVKSRLDIQIDGLVIKLNNLKQREELGFTSKFPKWAIAYKFAPMEVTSILRDVEWHVGRTGKLTPIGIVDPVELAGAVVSRATLNNYDDILRKRIKLNSRVFIRRSNEVIPEILGLAEELDGAEDILQPKNCPSCSEKLQKDGVQVFCNNPTCREKVISKLTYFASKKCMNIEGLRDKIIEMLYSNNKLHTFADFYKLKREDLQGLEGFQDKKINNVLNSINNSKNCELAKFLSSLSIDGVGEKTSKDLAKQFKNLDAIINAKYDDLIKINDIGDIIAKNIISYFKDDKNLAQIRELLSLGVSIQDVQENSINKENFFYNKKFVLTGTLKNYTRDKAGKIIESFGGIVASSVSKNTNYVLYGAEAGSKLDKAKSLGVKTITEQDFETQLNAIRNN